MDKKPFFSEPGADLQFLKLMAAAERLSKLHVQTELLERIAGALDNAIMRAESDDPTVRQTAQGAELVANVLDAIHSLLTALSAYSDHFDRHQDVARIMRDIGWGDG